jgi:hypothetical protein
VILIKDRQTQNTNGVALGYRFVNCASWCVFVFIFAGKIFAALYSYFVTQPFIALS